MHVLQVESSKQLAGVIAEILSARGFRVDNALDDLEAAELASIYDYDLILLDWALAGLSAIRRLRSANVTAPLLVVSNDNSVANRIEALNAGADDFASRPIQTEELVARAKALIRRKHGHVSSVLKVGDITVDISQRIISVRGVPLVMTGREYQIVEMLAMRPGEVVTREEIMDRIYGVHDDEIATGPKILDVWVCRIRRKLIKAGAAGAQFQTIWGRGFALRETT